MNPSSAKTRRDRRVVLVGRPNVGKSTLFNRVSGSRRAIVTAVPGTTRDVLREDVEWLGTPFELVDTGGLFGASEDPMQAAVSEQGLKALDGATVIVHLVDGRDGVVPADVEVAAHARRVGVPVILAVNKIDDRQALARVEEFHQLGIAPVVSVASEHGLGVGDLLDEVVAALPGGAAEHADEALPKVDKDEIGISIVGRPNVGKSSLVNLLCREDRVLVSDIAGTTRDAIDTVIRWRGRTLRLVDTAGIRRPGKVAGGGQVESVSVVVAKRALQRADVAVLVFDASEPVAKQDAAIAGEAERAGCGIILAANKWDLVKPQGLDFAKRFEEELRRKLKFAEYAPLVRLSALTGDRAPKLVEAVAEVARARSAHIGTPELNKFLERVTKRHAPSTPGRREVRLRYGTQVATRPPTFLLFTNTTMQLHFSYERFLKNQLRETFGFAGTPIRLKVRVRHARTRGGRGR